MPIPSSPIRGSWRTWIRALWLVTLYNALKESVLSNTRNKLETTKQTRSFTDLLQSKSINQYFYANTIPTVLPKMWFHLTASFSFVPLGLRVSSSWFADTCWNRWPFAAAVRAKSTTRVSSAQANDGSKDGDSEMLKYLAGLESNLFWSVSFVCRGWFPIRIEIWVPTQLVKRVR